LQHRGRKKKGSFTSFEPSSKGKKGKRGRQSSLRSPRKKRKESYADSYSAAHSWGRGEKKGSKRNLPHPGAEQKGEKGEKKEDVHGSLATRSVIKKGRERKEKKKERKGKVKTIPYTFARCKREEKEEQLIVPP